MDLKSYPNPKPQTLNPKTLNPEPNPLNPTLYTLNPKPITEQGLRKIALDYDGIPI